MRFEWDEDKAQSNVTKHKVTFEEESTVWADPCALIALAPEHSSIEEIREWIIGTSYTQKVLIVVYTVRNGKARRISARKATRNERQQYEEESY